LKTLGIIPASGIVGLNRLPNSTKIFLFLPVRYAPRGSKRFSPHGKRWLMGISQIPVKMVKDSSQEKP
jgi:hypothetical protein